MSKKTIIWIIAAGALIAALFRFFFVFPGAMPGAEKPFMIRVRLVNNVKAVRLAARNGYKVYDIKTGEFLKEKGPGQGEVKITTGGVRVLPLAGGNIILNGKPYNGKIDIVTMPKGLDVINTVELEDYLRGVLPREVSRYWPFEAIKAQAIVSRSFAVYEAMHRKARSYDLTADTFSQVYGGVADERRRTTEAVGATRGKVLVYDGEVLPAYFNSTCGGHTADAARVWGEGPAPLSGVKCRWCRMSPYFRWKTRIPEQTIVQKFNRRGYTFKRIDAIREGPKDDSGRLEYLKIKTPGEWIEIATGDFRSILGRRVLKSANFSVKKRVHSYVFSGVGWGHGVGMCQWGALGLALKRWSTERILEYYYPGAKIEKLKIVGAR